MAYLKTFKKRFPIFKELLDNEEFLNTTLITDDGGELKVHLEVIGAVSTYFRQKIFSPEFAESHVILVPGVSRGTLKEIIDFIYTDKLVLRDENVKSFLDAGIFLGYEVLIKNCKRYWLSNITVSNCISRYYFGKSYGFADLTEKTTEFILTNIEHVYLESTEYKDLGIEDITDILSSDKLNVKEEKTVFLAIIRWIETGTTDRRHELPTLLRCLRIGLCNVDFFQDCIWSNELITGSEDCQPFLFKASELFADMQHDESLQPVFQPHHPFLRPRVPNEIIFVTGGWSAGSATNLMETYDYKTQRWFPSVNSDSKPRAYHGMIWHQEKIYILGGFDGSECFNSVRTYDPVTHVWDYVGCMHDQRCYICVATVGKYIYAMGGYDGQHRNRTCEVYDPPHNQWNYIAEMNSVRSDAGADSLDGKVYIVGGFNGSQVLQSAECYNPESNEWTMIPNLNTPRSGVKAVAFKGYLYAIGGFNGNERLASVERYDKWKRRWTFVTPMSGPRSNFATCVSKDLIYVIGGFNGLSTVSSAEAYDPADNTWRHVTDLNFNRSALSACTVSNIPNGREYSYLGTFVQEV